MFGEGDTQCLDKLLNPSKRVVKEGLNIKFEDYDWRVNLWNQIKGNYEKYMDGDCGAFFDDIDNHVRSQFDASLLILAATFLENAESFPPAQKFSDKEIQAYRVMERYNYFELYSTGDIAKKLVVRDDHVLELLRDYYIGMNEWMDTTLEDPSVKLTIRYFLMKKWRSYKDKLNRAVNGAVELDWFVVLLHQWQMASKEESSEYMARIQHLEERNREKETAIQALECENERKGSRIQDLESETRDKSDRIEEITSRVDEKEQQVQGLQKKIDAIRRSLKHAGDNGSRFVRSGEAKQYEMNFIGRFEHNLGDEVTLLGRRYRVESATEQKREDLKPYLGSSSSVALSELTLKNIPENRFISANLVERKLLGSKQRFSVQAQFLAHVSRFVHEGFDSSPLSLDDVVAFLSDARDSARQRGERHLLCIASPTGFDSAVARHINSDDFHKNFISRYLSLCLLDTDTAQLFYNPHDELAREFSLLCEMMTDNEKREKIRQRVEDRIENTFATQNYIVFNDIVDECGEMSIVKGIFYDIGREKGYKITRVDEEIGLVMMK